MPKPINKISRGPKPNLTAPFHFDNLFTKQDVIIYWRNLENISKEAIYCI
jgi:hypothetical protein